MGAVELGVSVPLRTSATREFPIETYRTIVDGLRGLFQEVQEWNKCAKELGADAGPYEAEARLLSNLLRYGAKQLQDPKPWVVLHDLSPNALAYMRAGLEFGIRKRRDEISKRREEGWPPGVLHEASSSNRKRADLAESLHCDPAPILWEVLGEDRSSGVVEQIRAAERFDWDVFVCHASEDKEPFVAALAEALKDEGVRVWYDASSLKVGDSLRRSIDRGLARSRYGVVVLSPSFFAKEWPQRELDGMAAREVGDKKVILPVWHKIDRDEIRQKSPTLADRVALRSSEGIEAVVKRLVEKIKGEE